MAGRARACVCTVLRVQRVGARWIPRLFEEDGVVLRGEVSRLCGAGPIERVYRPRQRTHFHPLRATERWALSHRFSFPRSAERAGAACRMDPRHPDPVVQAELADSRTRFVHMANHLVTQDDR